MHPVGLNRHMRNVEHEVAKSCKVWMSRGERRTWVQIKSSDDQEALWRASGWWQELLVAIRAALLQATLTGADRARLGAQMKSVHNK